MSDHIAEKDVHDIEVVGRWHNDNTAGVETWCNTCDSLLVEGDEYNDRLTLEQIAEAVAAHRTRVTPSEVGQP